MLERSLLFALVDEVAMQLVAVVVKDRRHSTGGPSARASTMTLRCPEHSHRLIFQIHSDPLATGFLNAG
jgi:hypothetical protein